MESLTNIFLVILLEVDSKKYESFPICYAFIFLCEMRDELISIFFIGIFHAKVVHDEVKKCWLSFVFK